MRIEELQNNMYIKSTDSVEKYLLNIIQEYFRDSNEALEGSKEYIIREAVDRLRTEMDYNSLGVLSITLPNGETRTGDVSITLEDLGGEPLISPKLSAFNVNFGNTANTACEGNDPRLYDARKPIKHEHEISDIRGLDGILSTIMGQIERTDVYNHTHANKDLLDILEYTGDKTSIDLGILDTLEPKIDQITEQIRQDIEKYIRDTETEIDKINAELVTINQRIDAIYQYVLEKCEEYLLRAKQYTDTVFDNSVTELTNYIDTNYVKKENIQELIDIANQCYTFVNTDRWSIKDLYIHSDQDTRIADLTLSQATLDEFFRRAVDIATSTEVIFKFYLQYERNGVKIKQPLPHMDNFSTEFKPFMYPLIPKLTIAGYIEAIQQNNNKLQLVFQTNENQLTDEMLDGDLVCDIYAKAFCPVYY
jgi:hypothetical protein